MAKLSEPPKTSYTKRPPVDHLADGRFSTEHRRLIADQIEDD